MGMAEQQLKEIAVCEMRTLGYTGGFDEGFQLIKRFLAALPKPEPVGHFIPDSIERPVAWNQVKRGQGIPLYREPSVAPPASEQKPVSTWIVVQRQGFSAVRKGPLVDSKHTEQMLRELYELHPDCICTVIAFDHAEWPEDGREWLSIYGDGRRKKPTPAPNYKAQRDALLKASKQLLIAVKHLHPCPGTVATMEAAIASVKGGA